jgi:hypothetical protein
MVNNLNIYYILHGNYTNGSSTYRVSLLLFFFFFQLMQGVMNFEL